MISDERLVDVKGSTRMRGEVNEQGTTCGRPSQLYIYVSSHRRCLLRTMRRSGRGAMGCGREEARGPRASRQMIAPCFDTIAQVSNSSS